MSPFKKAFSLILVLLVFYLFLIVCGFVTTFFYEHEVYTFIIFIYYLVLFILVPLTFLGLKKLFQFEEMFVALLSLMGVLIIFFASNFPGEYIYYNYLSQYQVVSPHELQSLEYTRVIRFTNENILYDDMVTHEVTLDSRDGSPDYYYVHAIPIISKDSKSPKQIEGFIYLDENHNPPFKKDQLYTKAFSSGQLRTTISKLDKNFDLPEIWSVWEPSEYQSNEELLGAVNKSFTIYNGIVWFLLLLYLYFFRQGIWEKPFSFGTPESLEPTDTSKTDT